MNNSTDKKNGTNVYVSKKIFRLSLLLNSIAVVAAIAILLKYGGGMYSRLSEKFHFKKTIIKIAIAGDSRVENGHWEKGLQRDDVKNCAIGGILTAGYLIRLNSAVIQYHPKICILQIGINDIRNKVSVDSAAAYYTRILDSLSYYKIEPVVTSTLFLRKDFWQDEVSEADINNKTDSLNQKLIAICKAKHIAYLDINRDLAADNRLKREYTFDGIHLNNDGYALFYKAVNEYLKKSNE